MSAGRLYLAPCTLGEASVAASIPDGVQARLHRIGRFLVEEPKTARAFLRAIGHPRPLADLAVARLPRDAPPQVLDTLLAPVAAGEDAAVLSEAGAPAVADPGAALVRRAHAHGIVVTPLVGPSSILLALMASGLEGQRFAFHGYLPVPELALRARLKALEADSRRERRTEIFIETPYRNDRLLRAVLHACAPRTLLCVACALTGADERIDTRTIADWRARPAAIGKRPAVFLLLAGDRPWQRP